MSATLPPLPKPDTHCWDDETRQDVWSHSPDQMRAYGAECARAARLAEREACALLVDSALPGSPRAATAAAIRARSET